MIQSRSTQCAALHLKFGTLPLSIFNEEIILKPTIDLPDIGYAHLAGNKLKIKISKS